MPFPYSFRDLIHHKLLNGSTNPAYAKEIALNSLQNIDNVLVEQIRGISYLHNLFEVLSNKKKSRYNLD